MVGNGAGSAVGARLDRVHGGSAGAGRAAGRGVAVEVGRVTALICTEAKKSPSQPGWGFFHFGGSSGQLIMCAGLRLVLPAGHFMRA